MIELLVYLFAQLSINLVIRFIPLAERAKYIYCSLATLLFTIGMMIYPLYSDALFYTPDPDREPGEIRCGNPILGSIIFQWIFGTPLVFFFQRLLNKLLFKEILEKRKNK